MNLIIGCGGTGLRVAARAVAAGDRVTGVVRSVGSARNVRATGAAALMQNLDTDTLALPACDRLFHFAPPQRDGRTDTRIARVIAAIGAPPKHVVYISTSGVYGDCDGAEVTEDRPLAPTTDRARRRVDAEQQLLRWCPHATILRAPGIYGPGRLPLASVRAAAPVLTDADSGWSNRIHIDDLAAIAWRAGQQHWPQTIYNACDGKPTRMGDYHDALAQMLELPPPPRIDWATAQQQFSAMRLSFLRESRRLSNERLRHDFGYEFVFADFRDGLAASLAAENNHGDTAMST